MQLSFEERETLEAECGRRTQALAQDGWIMPGVEAKLVAELLCELISPIGQANAKERWLFWLCDQLDRAEANVRQAKLSGVLTNGHR